MAISLASLVRKDRPKPPIMVIYGPGGLGKTSIAATFPDTVFIQTEDGNGKIPITSFSDGPLASYRDVMDALTALATEDHPFKTVAIDSVTRLEPLIWAALCHRYKWDSIEDAGYGKGYIAADEYWQDFLAACRYLRDERGMTVVMIAHETVTNFKDPTTDSYDKYSMRLHKRAEAMVRELSDAVLFLNQVTMIKREQKEFGKKDDYKAKGAGSGIRALSCQPRPAFDAKNRLGLPDQLIINDETQGYSVLAPYLPQIN